MELLVLYAHIQSVLYHLGTYVRSSVCKHVIYYSAETCFYYYSQHLGQLLHLLECWNYCFLLILLFLDHEPTNLIKSIKLDCIRRINRFSNVRRDSFGDRCQRLEEKKLYVFRVHLQNSHHDLRELEY